MLRFALLITLLAGCAISNAQVIDNLKQKLSETPPTDKNNTAYLTALIAYTFYEQKEYDSALTYYYRAWHQREGVSNAIVAETANGIGAIYSIRDYHDSTLLYYEFAVSLYKESNDSTGLISTATNLAILYKDLGLYEKALDVCFEILPRLEEKAPSRELASLYSSIAVVYGRIEEHETALEFHRKALAVRKALDLKKAVSQSYNNIGESFTALGLYDSALANLNKSLEIKKANGDEKAMPVTLNNIGIALLELNRVRDAEPVFLQALNTKSASEDRTGRAVTLNNLGRLYLALQDFPKASRYLAEGEKLIREIGSPRHLADNLDLKVKLQKATRNSKELAAALEELLVIRDSLLSTDKVESMLAIEARYETEKKMEEIERLGDKNRIAQAELEGQKLWTASMAIGVFLTAIIAFLVYGLFRSEKKRKAHAEVLLKEMHHRIKNNLQILSSLFILQAQELTDEKAVEAVKTSESRVNAMALIHKKLYNTDQAQTINLREYITELIHYLIHSYGFANRELKLDLEIEEIKLDVDKAIPLALILNELVSNTFKHAFADNPLPSLKVNASVQAKKVLVLHLQDNGNQEMTEASSKPDSFGLRMVNALTSDLKGTLSISHGNGTGFSLNIPLT